MVAGILCFYATNLTHMRTVYSLISALALTGSVASAALAPSSLWELNGTLAASIGTAGSLGTTGGWSASYQSYDGSAGTDVLRFSKFGNSQGLRVDTADLAANGGGSLVNNYTVMMDVKFDSFANYVSLYQTAPNPGSNDADSFINRGGAGVGSVGKYSNGTAFQFQAGEWYRLAIVNDLPGNAIHYYVNGALVNSVTGRLERDGRWALYGETSPNGFYLFADDSSETSAGALASLAVWDSALSAADIAEFGAFTQGGIGAALVPEPSTYAAVGALAALGLAVLRRRNRRGC